MGWWESSLESQQQTPDSPFVLTHLCCPQLSGCNAAILKRETMRPSSRVALMVLCETHRARMVKHHCCPGCGYFCTAVSDQWCRHAACPIGEALRADCVLCLPQGTFLECHPDFRVAHRFHKACVSQLNGMVFCPHCGEDASEAQEVTIPRGDGGTPPAGTAAPAPPPLAQDAPGRADTSQPRYWPPSCLCLFPTPSLLPLRHQNLLSQCPDARAWGAPTPAL